MTTTRISSTDLIATLEDRGCRITSPRRDFIALLERKEGGFSAEELCSELPGVGRATIYRTLKLLLEAGVLCKLAMPDGAPKYTLARFDHHHHAVCVQCGLVTDFRDSTIERLMRAVGSEVPGKVVGHRLEVYMTCQGCLVSPAD
ncbi:MAG: transcriptional repressor [Chloroflexi bacterium]|nr:transcriptional repressor [Chloroflexota bacterium]